MKRHIRQGTFKSLYLFISSTGERERRGHISNRVLLTLHSTPSLSHSWITDKHVPTIWRESLVEPGTFPCGLASQSIAFYHCHSVASRQDTFGTLIRSFVVVLHYFTFVTLPLPMCRGQYSEWWYKERSINLRKHFFFLDWHTQ